ncbi:MAG TPA: hypothetical protein VFA34_11815 [Actinomycetota bacterium]|jgi:hypothetical protein|nr:hypothetical protein [Actinomycetota bacterium]
MRRSLVAALVLALSTVSCLGGSPQGASTDLSDLAEKVTSATYAAVYRYSITGPLAPSVRTSLEIVQDPPVSVRRLETATPDSTGKPVSLRSWQVRNAQGDFACTDYQKLGVRCVRNPIVGGTFGSAQIDEFFDMPKKTETFSSVRRSTRRFRVLGEQGTCFEAVPVAPTEPPITSPQPVTTSAGRFRYELCYAEDGILLRGRRTILEDVSSGPQREVLIEAVSISRVVEPRELRLPGPVTSPEDLRR